MDRLKQDCLAAYPGPTHRLRFRSWTAADGPLAAALWDDGRVTALIGGPFGEQRVREMLEAQLATGREAGVQYWPVFESGSGSLVGCCGLRPKGEGDSRLELGGKGFATGARLERAPCPGREHPSRRAYPLARKTARSQQLLHLRVRN